MSQIIYIDQAGLTHKKILMRVDFNVALKPNHAIADDARIKQAIPTLAYLLKHKNKLILMAHQGEPEKRTSADSLERIAKRLHEYLTQYKIVLVDDFLDDASAIENQKEDEIIVLENIRFYPGEKANNPLFAKQLAALADVYVNDAFSVSHRNHTSVVGIPPLLPSYGGLLLKKEVMVLNDLLRHAHKPFVAIIGGKKISTKIKFINKLITVADSLLLGGGLANTFLAAQGHKIGSSIFSKEDLALAQQILTHAKRAHTEIVLPKDVVVGAHLESTTSEVRKIDDVQATDEILDIGPETEADFGAVISGAKTIVWNGPVGYIENPVFKRGTDFLYYAITENTGVTSVIGGGDTLAAIAKKEYLDKITHISMAGGAMLEFIENGTLPGIEALKKNTD